MKEGRRHNITYTQVGVITKVKALPTKMVTRAKNLADLDFLKFIKIPEESLSASIENYPSRRKVHIAQINHNTAIGMQILNSTDYKTIDFFVMSTPVTGNGSPNNQPHFPPLLPQGTFRDQLFG